MDRMEGFILLVVAVGATVGYLMILVLGLVLIFAA